VKIRHKYTCTGYAYIMYIWVALTICSNPERQGSGGKAPRQGAKHPEADESLTNTSVICMSTISELRQQPKSAGL